MLRLVSITRGGAGGGGKHDKQIVLDSCESFLNWHYPGNCHFVFFQMDDLDLYDEFGNYIGGGEGEVEEAYENEPEELEFEETEEGYTEAQPQLLVQSQVVLHEDKKYYPSALEVYGPGIEISVQDEDTQMLSEPIIAPVREIKISHEEVAANQPALRFAPSAAYFHHLTGVKSRTRAVAFVGHIHHGKTSILDCLIASAHVQAPTRPRLHLKNSRTRSRAARYLDSLVQERERGISLRMKPISLPLQSSSSTATFMFDCLDTPGHSDFRSEVAMALGGASDAAVLVVDCVEGVLAGTEACLRAILLTGHPCILVLNKLERLWLELKLAPLDAYFKLKHTIDSLNTLAGKCLFSPETGNVIFASAEDGWAFSLKSWCQQNYPQAPPGLYKRLWGDIYYDGAKGFYRTATEQNYKRTFVSLVLEPLYKLYTSVISAPDHETLQAQLSANLGIKFKLSLLKRFSTPSTMLAGVLNRFFQGRPVDGLIDAIIELCPAPSHSFDELEMLVCKVFPPATIKFKSAADTQSAIESSPRLLCRLLKGTLQLGQPLQFIDAQGEAAFTIEPSAISIPCTRYEWPIVDETTANFVLLSGIPLDRVLKRGIIGVASSNANNSASLQLVEAIERLWKLNSLMRISCEPIVPSELPRMLSSLRLLSCLYPSLKTHVEENGEHVMFVPGELYADCILHDLRHFTGGAGATNTSIQVRISDPSVGFAEGVQEISTVKCVTDTMNGLLRISMIAEPLETGLAEYLDANDLMLLTSSERSSLLCTRFNWDKVSARGLLASSGACVFVDDTFGERAGLLAALRPSLIQGFQWACREGPLCEAPMRGVRFRLCGLELLGLDSLITNSNSFLTPAQIVPAARRACYSAFLTASPRLLEPVLAVQIISPGECIEAIYTTLSRRRGHVLADVPLPATPLYCINALLPLLDAAGFEIDLRVSTTGAAFSSASFDHWQLIPGDPLDTKIGPSLLEPATAPALARDCLLKTRKRRGLSDDVRIDKFFDEEMRQVLQAARIF